MDSRSSPGWIILRDLFDQITRLPQETSVALAGVVRADPRAPGIPGGYEIGINTLQVIQLADEDYPMALKEHGVDFALDNRHFWIRNHRGSP